MRYIVTLLLGAALMPAQYRIGNSVRTDGPINLGVESGSGNTFTVTITKFDLASDNTIWFVATHANTGAATLTVNGGSSIPLKKIPGGVATDLVADDIRTGQPVGCYYNGTNCIIVSVLGNAPSAGGGSTPEIGTYSAITGAPATPARAGYRTDGPFGFSLIANGTSWLSAIDNRILQNTVVAAANWWNQSTCTEDASDGTVTLDCTGVSDAAARGKTDTAAATGDWSYMIGFRPLCLATDCAVGVVMRHTTGTQFGIWGRGNWNQANLYGRYMTGTGTTVNAGPLDYSPPVGGNMDWVCITNNSTTTTAHYSVDGKVWVPRHSTIRTQLASGVNEIGYGGRDKFLIRVYAKRFVNGTAACSAL